MVLAPGVKKNQPKAAVRWTWVEGWAFPKPGVEGSTVERWRALREASSQLRSYLVLPALG